MYSLLFLILHFYFSFSPDPYAPADLNILSKTNGTVKFSWSPPNQEADIDGYNYVITPSGENTEIVNGITQDLEKSHTLQPGSTYTIKVFAIAHDQKGDPVTKTFTMGILEAMTHF